MTFMGRKRVIKFRVGQDGNPAYEALLNSPFTDVIKEHVFNSFEELFVTVWFYDKGPKPFSPHDHLTKSDDKASAEEDPDEVSD